MTMAKFLRFPSFQCCRSHEISVVPTDPPPPPSKPHHSSLRRHVSSAFTCTCGRRSSSTRSDDDDPITKTPRNLPPLPESQRRKKKKKKKKKSPTPIRISSSWAESESFFERDEGEETESLICSPARLSVFQRVIPCRVEGKMRESFAVVKKSEDPLEDFKRSMMEMIMEKEMFEHQDLEQLLHCLLSLNHRQFHQVIVQAFSEIWHSLFSNTSTCRTTQFYMPLSSYNPPRF